MIKNVYEWHWIRYCCRYTLKYFSLSYNDQIVFIYCWNDGKRSEPCMVHRKENINQFFTIAGVSYTRNVYEMLFENNVYYNIVPFITNYISKRANSVQVCRVWYWISDGHKLHPTKGEYLKLLPIHLRVHFHTR